MNYTTLGGHLCDQVKVAADLLLTEWQAEGWGPDARARQKYLEQASDVMAHWDGAGFMPNCLDRQVLRLARGLAVCAMSPGGVTFDGKHFEYCRKVEDGAKHD